jgi:hypothetical protein
MHVMAVYLMGESSRDGESAYARMGVTQELEEVIQSLEEVELLNDQMWEFNQDVGMMRVGFHPLKGKRRSTNITNFWSRVTNIHKEEALSRLGACRRTGGRAGGREGGKEGGREGEWEGGKERGREGGEAG